MPYTVLEVSPTPNPNALKFVLDRIIASDPVSFFSKEAAAAHPVASRLFEIHGIASLLILNDFITVNRDPTIEWRSITGKVRTALKKV